MNIKATLNTFRLRLVVLFFLFHESGTAQEFIYRELPDDPYLPVNRLTVATSPAYRSQSTNFFAIQVNTDEAGQNMLGDAANEPSIAIDPTDPNRMVIGWRQFDTTASNFRQAGYAYTTDGGESWTYPGNIESGIFRSDPVLEADASGRFYYSSLTLDGSDILMDVFRSTGDGTWDEGVFANGGDKQWMTIDRTSGPGEGHIYSTWSQAFSTCAPGYFNRSVDRGESYENCITIGNRVISFGTLVVGPDGELYMGGVEGDQVLVGLSTNANQASEAVVWDRVSSVNLLGRRKRGRNGQDPNPGGLLGQTWVAVNQSDGPERGHVYLLSSVERTNNEDPLDVMFSRSVNGGVNWSTGIRINDDPTNRAWQWFGTMSVAPNGRIDAVWLDTRDDLEGFDSALYYSFSEDDGLTWSDNERLSESFDPHLGWPQQNKMGDYFDMISDNDHAHLAWAGTFNGEQDVYYGRITPNPAVTNVSNISVNPVWLQASPNPFTGSTTLDYRLDKKAAVRIEILDYSGKQIAVLFDGPRSAGEHQEGWTGTHHQNAGIFFYRFLVDGRLRQAGKLVYLP